MKRQSTPRNRSRKAATARPPKPRKDFPLFPHATGRWAKKIKGRLRYFGQWGTRRNGKFVRLPGDGWQEAEALYELQRSDLYAGRQPKQPSDAGCTLRDVCNRFLTSKQGKLESGELSRNSFADYHRVCDRMIDFFGRSRRVDQLCPEDFESFRRKLAVTLAPRSLGNEINRCRMVFKYASDQRLIREPVHYGQSFDKPSAKMLRKARNEAGPRVFTVDDLRTILDALAGKPVNVDGKQEKQAIKADPFMRAMVLLGVNGGLGNMDIANLPKSAVDFAESWLDYPRPKTEIQRRIPLWPETADALKAAIDQRPDAKDPNDDGLCFITIQGNRWVRVQPHKTKAGTFTTVNTIGGRFSGLLNRLGIKRRKGLGFYTLRHNFETIAGGTRDQVAVDAVMGHVDNSMAAAYREGIEDDRLKAVTDHVRRWLFGDDLVEAADENSIDERARPS